MKSEKLLDLYSDYLISAFGQTTATGLSELLNGEISHDHVQRYLAGAQQTSVDLWRVVKAHVRKIESATGVLIAYATMPGEFAMDGSGQNSPYAEALAAEIVRGGTIYDVFNRVRGRVEDLPGDQSPRETNGLRGSSAFCFGACAATAVGAAENWQPGHVFRDCRNCPEMVVIPGGANVLGPPGQERSVTVASFAAGRFEVTFDQWQSCVDAGGCTTNPSDSGWGRVSRPVINVSWHDAQQYVAWLSAQTGNVYRLLTEDEWEYAARAGGNSIYSWGVDPEGACLFGNVSDATARRSGEWAAEAQYLRCDDGHLYTAPVGIYRPNGFLLHDMDGNVVEWVEPCAADAGRRCPILKGSYFGADADEFVVWNGLNSSDRSLAWSLFGIRVARNLQR